MNFLQILGGISIIAGIASSIATVAGYVSPHPASTRQRLTFVGVPLAIILIGAGVLSLLYSLMPHSAGITTGNGSTVSTLSLARSYQGTITDEDALNTTSAMFLCAVTQSGNNITGEVKLSLFSGSGPFTGTIGSDNSVRFSIINADDGYGPSDFNGFINPDGSMSGRYINHSLNHRGSWQVKPSNGNAGGNC